MEEFMTPGQVARAKRNDKICAEFRSLRDKNPDTRDEGLLRMLAQHYKMTSGNIRLICKKAGLC